MARPPAPSTTRTRWRRIAGLAIRLAIFAALVLALHRGLDVVLGLALRDGTVQGRMLAGGILIAVLVAYTVLIAIPFVPGIEIGLSLMMLRGAEIAPVIYLATLAGLLLGFFAGRLLPYGWLIRVFADLHLVRAHALLTDLQPLSQRRRLALLRRSLPPRLGGWAVRWRYPALALILNVPGNSLLGGGGGICLIAGLSRLFGPWRTAATLALAVLPVPLAVWVFGASVLG